MRPSGRNAMRHGSSKVATCVMVKGRLESPFCSPALVCAKAPADNSAERKTAIANFIICLYLLAIDLDFESLFQVAEKSQHISAYALRSLHSFLILTSP